MARPHNHPSVTCYKRHLCRCTPCKVAYNADTARRRKARKERGYALTDPTYSNVTQLPDWELHYLRRAVGLE